MQKYSKFIVFTIILVVIFIIVYFVSIKNDSNDVNRELSLKVQKVNDHIKDNKIDIGRNINLPLYYINLERSEDRRESIKDQLRETSVKSTRVPAIDGKKLNLKMGNYTLENGNEIKYQVKNFEKCPKNKYTETEIACTISHIMAINTAYKNGDDYALIVEDDIFFGLSSLWKEDLKTLISSAPKDWGIIQLCIGASRDIDLDEVMNKGFFRYLHGYGAVAYVINKKGMESFLHFFVNDNINLVNDNFTGIYADGIIYENIENKDLGAYVIFPRFVPNNEKNKSTIGKNHDIDDVNFFASSIIGKYLNNLKID